jgi:hypothetical protein
MTPLRKPPEFEGFPLFATGTRKVVSSPLFTGYHESFFQALIIDFSKRKF